ncbi:MAG: M81 family metallopeptidase [Chloroflexota bacterium]|nr:M81 family metallopeptidase [Chloroflexota bacterium]
MKIALTCFMHESNTFIKKTTPVENFMNPHYEDFIQGKNIVEHFKGGNHELSGSIDELEKQGIEFIPKMCAIATPSGTVEKEAFNQIVEKLVNEINSDECDGLIVNLHGATVSEEYLDADGEVLLRLRKKLGEDFPIVCTLDKHANISTKMFKNADVLIVFRTCPHLDTYDRGVEAAKIIIEMIKKNIKPTGTFIAPPMMINMTKQNTFEEPVNQIIKRMEEISNDDSVVSASFALGFQFADVPELGSSFIVYTNNNLDLSRIKCESVAKFAWENRKNYNLHALEVSEAVEIAKNSTTFPVILNDVGDNTGGGSSADSTFLLQEIIKQNVGNYCTVFFDPESVQECVQKGLGEKVQIYVGGKVDDQHGNPVKIQGVVKNITDGIWEDSEIRHGGYTKYNQGITALVETSNGGSIILTTLRQPPQSIGQITHIGIDPNKKQLITTRGVILPRPAYDPFAAKTLLVNTKGTTTADLKNLNFKNIERGIYPINDPVFDIKVNNV